MHCSTNEQMIVGPKVFNKDSTVLGKAKLLKMQVDQPHIIDGLSIHCCIHVYTHTVVLCADILEITVFSVTVHICKSCQELQFSRIMCSVSFLTDFIQLLHYYLCLLASKDINHV